MAKYLEDSAVSSSVLKSVSDAVTKGVLAANRADKALAGNPAAERKKQYVSGMQKEAALARALTTEAGLRKIAANMANPVRFYLDYKGIFRKFAVVEQIPDGVPMISL